MRFVLLMGLCWIGCAGPQLSTKNNQAKDYYKSGLRFEKKASWESAIAGYRRAILEDNRFIEAFIGLGRVYTQVGNFSKACQFYAQAVHLDDQRDDLLLPYGKALFNSEQYHESYLSLLRYHNLHPEDAEATSWLAECARALNDPGAGHFFVEVTQLDSTNLESWIALAQYYFGEGEYAKALPVFERIMKAGPPPYPEAFHEYAICLALQERWSEAATTFEQAMKAGQDSPDLAEWLVLVRKVNRGTLNPAALLRYLEARTMVERGTTNSRDKKYVYETAVHKLKDALELQTDFKEALRELARLRFILGEDEKATSDYEKLIYRNEAGATDYANVAYLYFRKGDYTRAKEYYSKSYELDASQIQVKDYLATIQNLLDGMIDPGAYTSYEKGLTVTQSDSAEYYLLDAVRRDSTYYEAYLQLGITYLRMNKHKDAERQFLRGLVFVDDRDIERVFHYNLGLTYLDLDLHDKAVSQFLEALALDSLDGDSRYYLAQTYADKSELQKAVEAHDRLTRDHPDYFQPSEGDFRQIGLAPMSPALTGRPIFFDDSLVIGQTNTYELKIKSKNDALIGADANGDLNREISIVFDAQVQDITAYGEAEFALDILSVEGYALTSKERSIAGQRFYLRMSDVFGLTNVYGLLEGDPHSLQQFVIQTLEDLHGTFLRKPVTQGELWKSHQHVFQLGTIDAVAELDYMADDRAFVKKQYGIQGTYNAARYGEEGMVSIVNQGEAEFEFDARRRLITSYTNRFTTREFREATASSQNQEATYTLTLRKTRYEKLEPPKRTVLESVPYVRQHGPQCAAASLSMVLQFYGRKIDQDDIYATIKSDFAGAQANDILNYPRSLGSYKTFGYTGTLEDLKSRIDEGIPVLVFLTPFGYGHVVVVIGYDETKHQIIMHDPTVASLQAVNYDEFLQEWRESGNECAIVVPFDRTLPLQDGPIASHKAVELKWQGDKALGDHQYDKAMKLYRDAIAMNRGYQAALEGVMLLHLQKDQFSEASAILDTLLALNPTSIDLVLKRASLLLSQYDYDKVLQITKKAKQMDASNIINYVYTASALFAQKKYQEAIDEIKQAIKINPLQSTPRNMLAGYLAEVGEWEKAYEQAELAIKYEAENIGNYLTLSGLYQTEVANRFLTAQRRAKLIDKAIEALNVIKSSAPDLPNLDQIYGDVYTSGEQHRLGDSLFAENIKKFPEENAAYNNYAWRLATDNLRLTEAAQLSQKSIELSQRNPYYFDTMAWIHMKRAIQFESQGLKDSATAYFTSAEKLLQATIQYDRTSDFAYRHLGVVYARWGKMDLAKEQFRIVTEMLPDKARLFADIAKDCEEARLDSLALDYYRRSIAEKPNLDYALYRASFLLAQGGRELGLARSLIMRALESDSVNFLYRGTLGIVAYTTGDYSSAEQNLLRAIADQAGFP
ncbi:MAG: tetratricopeptide repeat protein, partial [Bacteroidetes bacterium]|nr:tetratricopeptide repeat protein [Bacteroidota bacterium]